MIPAKIMEVTMKSITNAFMLKFEIFKRKRVNQRKKPTLFNGAIIKVIAMRNKIISNSDDSISVLTSITPKVNNIVTLTKATINLYFQKKKAPKIENTNAANATNCLELNSNKMPIPIEINGETNKEMIREWLAMYSIMLTNRFRNLCQNLFPHSTTGATFFSAHIPLNVNVNKNLNLIYVIN